MGDEVSKRQWVSNVVIPNGFKLIRSGKHDIYKNSNGEILPVPHRKMLNAEMCRGWEKKLHMKR